MENSDEWRARLRAQKEAYEAECRLILFVLSCILLAMFCAVFLVNVQ